MKRKLLSIFLALIMIAQAVSAMAISVFAEETTEAVEIPCEEGEHIWELTEKIKSTCQKQGKESYRCSVCGETAEVTLPIGEEDHSWVEVNCIEPTCTEDGVIYYECSLCGATNQKISEAHHDWEEIERTESNCMFLGSVTLRCRACNAEEGRLLPPNHDWETIDSAEPTCTTEGFTYNKCTKCGASTRSSSPALGHNTVLVQYTPPSCTVDGVEITMCSGCGETYEKLYPAGHKWKVIDTVFPTCEKDGYEYAICSVCSESKNGVYPAKGHDFSISGSDVCTVCGEKCSHPFEKTGECSLCGAVITDANIVVECSDAVAGSEFLVKIKIENNPGVWSIAFEIPVDADVFEFISAYTDNSIFDRFAICNLDETTNTYKFNGYFSDVVNNLEKDGELISLKFRVKDGVHEGSYDMAIDLVEHNTINVDMENVAFNEIGGAVTVRRIALGDANCDGMISNADALTIFRYIYNSELYPLPANSGADADEDGLITNADVLLIFKNIYNPELYPIEHTKHAYSYSCDAECDVCGEYRKILCEDHYDAENDGVCDVCDEWIEHESLALCDCECDACGAEIKAYLYHIDEDKNGICESCLGDSNYTNYVPEAVCPENPSGHVYSNDCDRNCDLCGEERETEHKVPTDCSVFCLVCGKDLSTENPYVGHVEGEINYYDGYCGEQKLGNISCAKCDSVIYEFGHSYKKTTVDATCEKDGATVYTCVNCGDSYSETVMSSGHIEDSWVVKTKASCYADGEAVQICMLCGEVLNSKTIERYAHSYSSSVDVSGITYTCTYCPDSYFVKAVKYHSLTLNSNGGTEYSDIAVAEGEEMTLPTPTREGYEFSGWYYDSELCNLCPEEISLYEDITLYAGWYSSSVTGSVSTNTIITDVPVDFTFTVKSDVKLTDGELTKYITVEDMNGKRPSIYIASQYGDEYVIASDDYEEGMKYSASVLDPVTFADTMDSELWFVTVGENYCRIEYKDGVKFLSELDIYSVYENDEDIYIFLREDMFDVDDIVVVYGENEEDILFAMEIEEEGISELSYVYKVTAANTDLVFETYEIYYSGELDISYIELAENLEEVLSEQFMSSETYANFEYAAKMFASTYASDEYKYVYKGINTDYKFDKDGSKLIAKFTVAAKFLRTNSRTGETDNEFTIALVDTLTLKFNTTRTGSSPKNFSFVINIDAMVKLDLYATFKHSESESLEIVHFKKLYDTSKQSGQFKELDKSTASASKELTLGSAVIFLPAGLSITVDLIEEVSLDAVGELGVSMQIDMKMMLGIEYSSDDGIKFKKSFDSTTNLSMYFMGKVEASILAKLKVTTSFLGTVNVSAEMSIGPYFELGGMFCASICDGGGAKVILGGYLEIGTEVNASISASIQLKIKVKIFRWKVDKTITLYDKTWQLYSEKFPIYSIGKKEAVLYFAELNEVLTADYTCGKSVNISEKIDKYVVIQSLTEMTKKVEKAECKYYLEGKYDGITLTDDGKLQISNCNKDAVKVKIKVVSGDVYKYVTMTLTVKHTSVTVSAKDPTCTEPGNNEYTACGSCGKVLTGDSTPIAALDHDRVYRDDKDPTCNEDGWKNYVSCSRCSYLTFDRIPSPGHIDEIDPAVAPTCTEDGWTEGVHCKVCKITIVGQKIVYATGHKESAWIIDVDSTCTERGTKHTECTVCHKLIGVGTVDPKGHTESDWIIDVDPTCTETGTKYTKCTVCQITLHTDTVDALDHKIIPHQAKDPTCTEIGWYAYDTCDRCEYSTYVAIPENGHEYETEVIEPTCTEKGYTAYTCHCTYSYNDNYVDAKGHVEEIDEAVAPTCTETGLTEGKHCTVCKSVTVPQTVVSAKGHDETVIPAVPPQVGKTGLTEGLWCPECQVVFKEQEIVPMLYSLTVKANSDDYGSVTSTSFALAAGETAAVYATAKHGYKFVGWFKNGVLVSDLEAYQFIMPEYNLSLVARFVERAVDVWDGSVAASFESGNGTESDPYLVSTGAQLAYLSLMTVNDTDNNFRNKHYKLTNSIDMCGREWTPITQFGGCFDGNGYVISNFRITISNVNRAYGGIFGWVQYGTIKNLGAVDFVINVQATSDCDVGGIAGLISYGTIEKCYAIGEIKAEVTTTSYSQSYTGDVGGIVGEARRSSTIKNCYTICNIECKSYERMVAVGGIVGALVDSSIENCYSAGTVAGITETGTPGVAGLASYVEGYNEGSRIINSFTLATLSGTSNKTNPYPGALYDVRWGNSDIKNNYYYEKTLCISNGNEYYYNYTYNGREESCSMEALNSTTFYSDTLGWDASIWNFTDLDIENGIYPTLNK